MMGADIPMIDGGTEHIARISYGKDSLKMLEVIRSRGLPLDRITTTDVWATDTIPAYLPPLVAFRDRMDQWIWDQYRIEVEHLCSRNKDGTKRTYEQMFYHVPVRKNSQSVQVERERERERTARVDLRIPGSVVQMVSGISQERCTGYKGASKASPESQESTGARNSKFVGSAIKGFPLSRKGNGVKWCQDLKTVCVFSGAPDEAQRQKYR